jgi:hypothetical protein
MGSNAFILLPAIIELLQLHEPVYHSYGSNHSENPVNGIGCPPIIHESEKVIRPKQAVYE